MCPVLTRRNFLRLTGSAASGSILVRNATDESKAQTEESWPQYGFDSRNTRYARSNTGPVSSVTVQWRVDIHDYAPPVVFGDTIYCFSPRGPLYAIAADTGEVRWEYGESGGDFTALAPAVTDQSVFITDGFLIAALRPEDGTIRWSFERENTDGVPPVLRENTVFITSGNGSLHAINTDSGERIWTNQYVDDRPAITEDTVYTCDDRLFAYETGEADSGDSLRWTSDFEDFFGTPTVRDNVVYASNQNGVSAINRADGTETWTFELDEVPSDLMAVTDDMVYTRAEQISTEDSNTSGYMYAIDRSSGELQWTFDPEGTIRSAPAVTETTVYVGNANFTGTSDNGRPEGTGHAYGLDAETGEVRWRVETDGVILSDPAVANGTAYFTTPNSIYAITGDTELMTTSSASEETTTSVPSSTEIQETPRLSQQRGTVNDSQRSSDSQFGVTVFDRFGDSRTTLGAGGLAAALGLGGGYAAYRYRKTNNEEE